MRKLLILVLILLISLPIKAQSLQDKIESTIIQEIDSMPEGFAVSVAVIKNDTVSFIGFNKYEGDLVQVDNRDSLFEIGSITKVFTSTVLAANIVDGIVRPTDPVNKVFPFKFNNKIKLTYLSLSNHTSGVYRLPMNLMPLIYKDRNNPYCKYSYDMLDEYLKDGLQLQSRDSVCYSYSNLGAAVLAYALAKKNKTSFEDLIRALITEKYGMSSTSYDANASYQGIGPDNSEVEGWEFNSMKGAGGVISNTNDLSKFISAQFNKENTELSLTRKETFRVSDNLSIGMGWHIIAPDSKDEKYWHNGGTGGYTSSTAFRTTNKTGVVVLSNISVLHKKAPIVDELCFELLDLLR